MALPDPPPGRRRGARRARWVATGVTAAVGVAGVGAMEATAPDPIAESAGEAWGTMAGHQGTVAAALMAAADAGDEAPDPIPPPRLGRAGVS